jgi:rhodanese-related sulfurtransferase
MFERIDCAKLRDLLEGGAQLVEVLPPEEYAEEHLPGAISTPLKQLDAESSALRGAHGMTAEQLMEPGPSTIRADEMIEGPARAHGGG